ncbi:DNA polymerase kappa, partial [Phenoliferia sp. Uapishka_3]
MQPPPQPNSAANLLRIDSANAQPGLVVLSTSADLAVQTPSIGKTKRFRFSNGDAVPPPIASTSSIPISLPPRVKRPRSPSPKRVEVDVSSAALKVEPRSPGPKEVVGEGKGKGRANEREIMKAKEYADQEKSLMNRLSGPSDQKAGLKRDPEEVRLSSSSTSLPHLSIYTLVQVKKIIYEASKGSAYYLNEARKDEELSRKVETMVARVNKMVEDTLNRFGNLKREEAGADEMIRQLEKTRDLSQTIVVVDADAFYASCHELESPELKGTAFAVGNGVLTTASYEARKYGCRSAMAGFVAKKLCPELNFVKLDFSLYTRVSKEIMEILRDFGDISPASLDEAYCSLTEYCQKNGVTPTEAAEAMRARVKEETGCTVSAGVSSNTLLSKIAADIPKPDGCFVVPPTREGAIDFMRTLSCRRVPGIGRVTERWLEGLGVKTIQDIYDLRGKLYLVSKEINLSFLLRAYLGLGNTQIRSRDRIIKLDSFERITRARTIGKDVYFKDAETLYREGKKLLDKEISDRKTAVARGQPVKGKKELTIRLLGLRVSNLRDDAASTGKLDSWAGKTKPGSSKKGKKSRGAKTVCVKNEHNDEDLTGDFSEDELVLSEEKVRFIAEGGIKEEDQESAPASSDPLWAAIDGEDGDSYLAELEQMDQDLEEEEEKYKPFFTAGPSLNSRLAMESLPAPERDRLAFGVREDPEDTLGVRKLQCPVCDKSFLASEAAFSSHVNSHFGKSFFEPKAADRTVLIDLSIEDGPPQAPARASSTSSSSTTQGPSKKKKKVGTIDSYFGGRR